MPTLEATVLTLIMLLAVVVSRCLARITRAPVPLVQIVLGAAIFYAHVIEVVLDPEVFFVLLLPPLLFLDGWRIPKDELLREAPTILTLALGLALATLALPRLLKGMSSTPDHLQLDAANRVHAAATDAGIAAVKDADDGMHDGDDDAVLVHQARQYIVAYYQHRKAVFGGDTSSPEAPAQADRIERALRLAGLRAERDEIPAAGPGFGLKEVALRKLAREIDLQEARHSG